LSFFSPLLWEYWRGTVSAHICWIIPCFCYRRISAKKKEKIAPLIEQQYEAIAQKLKTIKNMIGEM